MSRVSIDSLLAEKRASPTVYNVPEVKPDIFSDDEIEKMASLLSESPMVEEISFQEKVAQALILGQILKRVP